MRANADARRSNRYGLFVTGVSDAICSRGGDPIATRRAGYDRGMRQLLLLTLLTACGSTSPATGDDQSSGDDGTVIDSGSHVDALTSTPTTCKAHHAITTQANGTKSDTISYFVEVTNVAPGDNVSVLFCDQVLTSVPPSTNPACPVGATCTTSGDALPTGRQCYLSAAISFVGTSATFYCGSGSANYDANGVQTSGFDQHYTSAEIRR